MTTIMHSTARRTIAAEAANVPACPSHYPVFGGVRDVFDAAAGDQFAAARRAEVEADKPGRGRALDAIDAVVRQEDDYPDMRVRVASHAVSLPGALLDRLTDTCGTRVATYLLLAVAADLAHEDGEFVRWMGKAFDAEQDTPIRIEDCGPIGDLMIRAFDLGAAIEAQAGDVELAEAAGQ